MEFLKKFFPLSFKYRNSGKELATGIIIQAVVGVVVGFVAGLIMGIIGALPAVPQVVVVLTNTLLGAISSIVGLYTTAGIVIEVLVFLKVIKD